LASSSRSAKVILASRGLLDRLQLPGTARVVTRALRNARGEREVILSTGVQMKVDLADRVERLCAFRAYERHELAAFRARLRPGDVVLDVGAHVGYYALHAAAIVGAANVHAFEPDPRNAARLRANAELNGFTDLTVCQMAVSHAPGRATFRSVTTRGETGWGSLMVDAGEATRDVEVEVTSLDAYARDLGTVAMIKVDVQGAELEVLEGARAVLTASRPDVVLELCDVYWGSRQTTTVADVLAFMAEHGYLGHAIGRAGRLAPLGEVGREPLNALFTHREQA
jgi:FkbM family methyltransferase